MSFISIKENLSESELIKMIKNRLAHVEDTIELGDIILAEKELDKILWLLNELKHRNSAQFPRLYILYDELKNSLY